ncbi:MAG: hypothetical protein RO469_15095 [Thermincola sp.]|nr:hypothetical protein [Thermincola sp.]MDT3702288.1 hypothetical protein [Thermincola sp.]
MSEDGEGRREVSLAVIAKCEAAILKGMPTEPPRQTNLTLPTTHYLCYNLFKKVFYVEVKE